MIAIVILKILPPIASIVCVTSSQILRNGKTMEPSSKSTWKAISMKSMSTLILKNNNPNMTNLKNSTIKLALMYFANFWHKSIRGWLSLTTSIFFLLSLWCWLDRLMKIIVKKTNIKKMKHRLKKSKTLPQRRMRKEPESNSRESGTSLTSSILSWLSIYQNTKKSMISKKFHFFSAVMQQSLSNISSIG
jgi:hypothetical protein